VENRPALAVPETGTRTRPDEVSQVVGVIVPHTHWDREWYAPFETMRFHLVAMLDELVEVLDNDPDLPAFLLDGQTVMLSDYLEVRQGQRERVVALVGSGRLRPGPFYVQPDEFHVSGEALVRNLLHGVAAAQDFGYVMREGYLPDTFGHVAQLPQLLRGFGIETFYAMRGFGLDVTETGSQFWWEAPDGSRVRAEWLTESYSNAAVLAADPSRMALRHGVLVGYDSLPELLGRLAERAPSGVLLLLNGGDHLRVQPGASAMVRALDTAVSAELHLGGLEEFSALVNMRGVPDRVVRGELRFGARHDVFDGIGSTRTPLKQVNEQTEGYLTGVAERLDAMASLVDGRTHVDSLRYAWRQLLLNYAHDSICGCSVDAVHEEMGLRFVKVGQVARAVAEDALTRLASAAAPGGDPGDLAVVVVNPTTHARTGPVTAEVLLDPTAPVGKRQFGWVQSAVADTEGYMLLDAQGRHVSARVETTDEVVVADALNRRKELLRHQIRFTAADVPPFGSTVYRLVAAVGEQPTPAVTTQRGERWLDNGRLRVEIEPDGRLAVTDHATGLRFAGLGELVEDGDAGDTYGFGPVPGDAPRSSREVAWTVTAGPDPNTLCASAVLRVPKQLAVDRLGRSAELADLPVTLTVRLAEFADRADLAVTVENQVRDHRLRMRFPTGLATAATLAETAYGLTRRDRTLPDVVGWHDRPTGALPLRRFVAVEAAETGLQILTEGLYEYASPSEGTVEVTLLRGVGWLARLDHPLRPHKVGPQLRTPAAQCLGSHTFGLALRPYLPGSGPGGLFRAAEEFAVPLQAWAVRGAPAASRDGTAPLGSGLAVSPAEAVVTAVKTAEDGEGVLVRMFNSTGQQVSASLVARFTVAAAERCDLEEIPQEALPVSPGGVVAVDLAAGQIVTVRLRPAPVAPTAGDR